MTDLIGGSRSRSKPENADSRRYNKFRTGVLGMKTKERSTDVDVRDYAKYLVREGTIAEKRELLSCLRSKLVLTDKRITLS
jgi:hypothetical protein